jgi:hypothetical protein
MKKYHMAVTFDYLQHQNTRIEKLVAVLLEGRYKAVKLKESSSTSIKYMLTHEEGNQIGLNLLGNFQDMRVLNRDWQAMDYEVNHDLRFLREFDLGEIDDFLDYDFMENEVRLTLIIDNLYDLDGQLEISLALSFNEDQKVILDKWIPWKSKKSFEEITHRIAPEFNNFENRDALINELSNDIFEDFEKSLTRLKEFLRSARQMLINRRQLHAVYLDLKNRNRSITSLTVGNQNMERIKGDLDFVSLLIRRKHRQEFTYVDFLALISKQYTRFIFENHSDFEISENRSYKALLKLQDAFTDDHNRRLIYEGEQIELLNRIVREFPDYFRGLEF